ncbi:MAG: hypothetical protein AAF725_11155, partial [Acidobacteriota bacterium]
MKTPSDVQIVRPRRSSAPRVAIAALLLAGLGPLSPGPAAVADPLEDEIFSDEITVSLVTVLARVLDPRGEPLENLEPRELVASIGETPVRVAAV